MLECPLCKMNTLKTVKVLGIELDTCDFCSGFWFDKGELATMLGMKIDVPNLEKGLPTAKKSDKMCPRCSVNMFELPYKDGSSLLIDYCKECGGVWLDPMEIGTVKGIAKSEKSGSLNVSKEIKSPALKSALSLAPGAKVSKASSSGEDEKAARKRRLAESLMALRKQMGTDVEWSCPVCKTASLHQFETSEKIVVDLCDSCQGMFFEKGELGNALELSQDLPGGMDRVIADGHDTNKKCPRCSTLMKELPFLKEHNLLIDVCQGCSGIWVDRGEYSKLEALSTEAESFGTRFGKLLKKIDDEGYTILGTA